MKLYLQSERHTLMPALCAPAVSARRVSPTVSLLWQESALAASVVPAAVAVIPAPVAVPAAALVPAARVAGATGSVRGDLPVRGTEPSGGEAEVRTDVTSSTTTDEIHVASAALLDQRGIRVQGTTGFSAKPDMTAPKPNGGVRGIPPRGRPV